MNNYYRLAFIVLLLVSSTARAALTIEITQGVEGATPIAVVPFGWSGNTAAAPENIAAIVTADLNRSGRFESLPDRDLLAHPTAGAQVQFQNWRMVKVDNLVIGKVTETADGDYSVQFELYDVFGGKQVTSAIYPTSRADLRRVAHHISDVIYEKLTGQRGAFNTQIAYVTTSGTVKNKTYTLLVADSDGYNPQTILTSDQPLMSPSWSPDGRQLALTLSRDGNPEIYIMDVANGALRRLTKGAAIDTEPVWTPDGRSIIFTSDRGGSAQIYRVPARGGKAERLTFEGKYNAGADISPDGRKIAMVHGNGGNYRIAVLDLESGLLRVLTDGPLDESPSFSPNGSMIIYATRAGNREVLSAVSVDGRFRQRLSLQAGNVREPVWSPFDK